MNEREKVIAAYECSSEKLPDKRCEKCPFGYAYLDQTGDNYFVGCNTERIMVDAIDLLKAQEPRVLTWPEVIGAAIECKPLYIEVKDSEDKEPGDDRWAMVTQYKDSITNGMIRAMSSYVTSEILFAEDYGKRWRCWTSRPDEKRRAETPWDC